jgi:hypothetical protein
MLIEYDCGICRVMAFPFWNVSVVGVRVKFDTGGVVVASVVGGEVFADG